MTKTAAKPMAKPMTRPMELALEMKKLRHRYLPLMFLAALALLALWMGWCLYGLNPDSLNDVSAMIYLNLLLMDTILCPVLLAATASRMCDLEQLGNTYKWLCTIQEPEHIYRGKVFTGSLYIGGFCALQTAVYAVLMYIRSDGLHKGHMAGLFATLFLTCLCIFILQLNLSLRCVNQLTPIFVSIGGTFIGLFSWFLNQWPLRYLVPWGYFAALCSTGYNYDETARYTTFYWSGFPFLWALVLVAVTAALYRHGRRSFLKAVRDNL